VILTQLTLDRIDSLIAMAKAWNGEIHLQKCVVVVVVEIISLTLKCYLKKKKKKKDRSQQRCWFDPMRS